jgi:hypothetical protein
MRDFPDTFITLRRTADGVERRFVAKRNVWPIDEILAFANGGEVRAIAMSSPNLNWAPGDPIAADQTRWMRDGQTVAVGPSFTIQPEDQGSRITWRLPPITFKP